MSIEMDNPKTTIEKVDAAANLVQQMFMSHRIHDESIFNNAHKKATTLLSEAVEELDRNTD